MKPSFSTKYGGLKCRVCLVKEGESQPVKIGGPEDIYKLVKDELAKADREMLLSIMLTIGNRLIGVETVSIGTLDSTSTSPREIFKSAILANAFGIILCHNHPSGDLTPSMHDHKLTEKLSEVGDLLGIKVIDHIIVSHQGFVSLQETNNLVT